MYSIPFWTEYVSKRGLRFGMKDEVAGHETAPNIFCLSANATGEHIVVVDLQSKTTSVYKNEAPISTRLIATDETKEHTSELGGSFFILFDAGCRS